VDGGFQGPASIAIASTPDLGVSRTQNDGDGTHDAKVLMPYS
jgi:hypothetical protein